MKNIFDLLGQELNIGDVIAYPVRSGSSMWMSFGKIYHLEEIPSWWNENEMVIDCRVITKSERSYSPDWTWKDKKLRRFINEQIELGNIPANLDYCYVCAPKKVGISSGLDRAIKINPDNLSIEYQRVLMEETWFVKNIHLK